jgi:outer membrane protein OmpA-like peptidoglycan-associated protein
VTRLRFSLLLLLGCMAPLCFGQSQPLYTVTVSRTIKSVTYPPSGSTRIDFQGTVLAPMANGEAKVQTNKGAVQIQAKFDKLPQAGSFGAEYVTYVLWAISPEGRARNLGEAVLNGDNAQVKAASSLQAFGMMLTAEPYFSVTVPSEVVVMENVIRPDTQGIIGSVDAQTALLPRGSYKDLGLQPVTLNSNYPLDLYEARNAVQVARSEGADKYATDTFENALMSLTLAEDLESQKDQRQQVIMNARQATQTAEDARVIAVKRHTEEVAALEKAEAAAKEAAAQAAANRETQQAAEAKAEAAREAQQKQVAELQAALAKAEAERQEEARKAADAAAAKAEADRLRAQLQAEQAKEQAEQARQAESAAKKAAAEAIKDQENLRASLLKQLNTVLITRDTPQGLVVNMGDVLFDSGKYDLQEPAKLALAKLSGIVLSHPGLRLAIDGFTDNVGGDLTNLNLSQQRADSVRAFLITQDLDPNSVTATGYGSSQPVASNDTAQGRQQNRRVEIIVSGEVIGVQLK